MPQSLASELAGRIDRRDARIGIVGVGYVGLPLWLGFAERGFPATAFDVDPGKVEALKAGRSYIRHIPDARIAALAENGQADATADFARLAEMDAVILCVPTPLGRHREPDLSYVADTAEDVAKTLRPGQLIVLESTTYPGTTDEVVRPILERGGLKSGQDFFLAYSPEREDPGNADYSTETMPKVVGGDGKEALDLACALYGSLVSTTVPVSSMATAEAVKLTENVFRAVNIALVNELKVIYGQMGVDVWEVVEAAKTKPFGYMPFYPGPGLGGHCIPIDPFYLAWKAREFDTPTRFIELAGEINSAMPAHVVNVLGRALNDRLGRSVKGARVVVFGVAYKKNVGDMRESPGLRLIELLEAQGAEVAFYDPFVPEIGPTREHAALTGRRSLDGPVEAIARDHDVALIATDHSEVDYAAIAKGFALIVDTRNAMAGLPGADNVVKA